ncbi:permease-like cell division protein FtsX [Oceanirhabdus sp. W0125-5]|uniref:permease-like cell division protein FtsX n=1 Tax=Oceanirhabdus sp. W0125-5 TaxID=2999116 RepID=UPI0022F31506|nr:permease-like cell division protein FtsX [Oceanirhabdus sp. W0125-5]WBW99283.1 permease-like cell division protein FtsX [Oceanirhabdus sp. W0125-5]
MKINTFRYFTSDASKSLSRNKTLTFASIATVTTTLLIFGLFLMVALNIRMFMDQIGSTLEIRVALEDNITIEQKNNLIAVIKNSDGYKDMKEKSKAEGQEAFIESHGEDAEEVKKLFEEFLQINPFPVVLVVNAEDSSYIDGIVENIKDIDGNYLEGIYDVTTAKDVIQKITKITSVMKVSAIVIFILLFIVSIFLIMNTIKLTVYSRKKEINIMKYVGATDWFIRCPFIIEGIIIGLVGSVISLVILYGFYILIYDMLRNILFVSFATPNVILKHMVWQFILGGIFIGSFGSVLSIRRFLKV